MARSAMKDRSDHLLEVPAFFWAITIYRGNIWLTFCVDDAMFLCEFRAEFRSESGPLYKQLYLGLTCTVHLKHGPGYIMGGGEGGLGGVPGLPPPKNKTKQQQTNRVSFITKTIRGGIRWDQHF